LLVIDRTSFNDGAWSAENFTYDLPMKWTLSTYAMEANKIIGFVIASSPTIGLVHLNRIAISSDVRGHGYGERFMKDLETRCTGMKSITLEFARSLDVGGFYEVCGYRYTNKNERRNYLKMKNKPDDDRNIMVKELC
jgi:N-acetylglutamate synthase-like GNAT family acetyltransferase